MLILALTKEPLGVALSAASILICSVILFSLFEFFLLSSPALACKQFPTMDLRQFTFQTRLWGTEKAHSEADTSKLWFRPLLNGVHLPVTTLDWQTDAKVLEMARTANRQNHLVRRFFCRVWRQRRRYDRLKAGERLGGLTVVNLGKSGYGPFQYLEVFRRFGINKRPKYALFGFYEGNDISDITSYLNWKSNEDGHQTTDAIGNEPFSKVYSRGKVYPALSRRSHLDVAKLGGQAVAGRPIYLCRPGGYSPWQRRNL